MRALPAFSGLEAVAARFRDRRFSPHRHDTYVVGITCIGVQQFRYRGEERFSPPGAAFVLHPGEIHDGRPATDDGYGYRAAYVPPGLIAEALGGKGLPFLPDPVSRHPRLVAAIRDLMPDRAEAASALGRAGALTALADALLAMSPFGRRSSDATDYVALARIKEQLEALSPAGIRLSDLEAEHGIDRYWLSRHFRRYFGVSPHRFIVLRRLDLSKRLIQEGASLADAAIASGFADQSHMTRHFRAAFGISPGAWRHIQE